MGGREYYLWRTGKLAKQINLEYVDITRSRYIDDNQELWNT